MMNNSIFFFSLQPSECETIEEDQASSGGGGGGATYVFQVSKDLSASPCEQKHKPSFEKRWTTHLYERCTHDFTSYSKTCGCCLSDRSFMLNTKTFRLELTRCGHLNLLSPKEYQLQLHQRNKIISGGTWFKHCIESLSLIHYLKY